MNRMGRPALAAVCGVVVTGWALASEASVVFEELVGTPGVGLSYSRVPSDREANLEALRAQGLITFEDAALGPMHGRGSPGVAAFDYDGDGDVDLFVTNGPGAANSLFSNQLRETGQLTFVDVAAQAGVAATSNDGSGACVGDIDNDGDEDLLVLGTGTGNRLFENLGGTFADVTAQGDIGSSTAHSVSCSMGDADGDGYLDIVIANSFNLEHFFAIFAVPFDLNEPNELYLNVGGHAFVDHSDASGIRDLFGIPPGEATITWAISFVDFDLDGDMDIVHGDDQGAVPSELEGGVNRGVLHVLENDGTAHFSDVTETKLGSHIGAWMGIDYGDLDCDGQLDFVASNLGDYLNYVTGEPLPTGLLSSRWFLGSPAGFQDPGVGDLVSTPFGWGTAVFDYDNDADQDIITYGGLDNILFVDASNHTGMLLQNQGCGADFVRDELALNTDPSFNVRRNVKGLAVADLDEDGFPDVVSASSFDFPEPIPLLPITNLGSPFDATAAFIPTFAPTEDPGVFAWTGIEFVDGSLSVQLNGGNDNGWVQVETLGSIGLTSLGEVNRDGIGAVVSVTPEGGSSTLHPVLGGSSYGSTHSRILGFGLGTSSAATVDVAWPGGKKNRLYDVEEGERILFPEIPCSIDAPQNQVGAYHSCVNKALQELKAAGVLTPAEANRFRHSAFEAFRDR